MNIHEWAAEQCGVLVYDPNDYEYAKLGKFWTYNGVGYYTEWTLDDARCREIVREHFKIDTYFSIDMWLSGRADASEHYAGKTIAEAEINCIKALEAQK